MEPFPNPTIIYGPNVVGQKLNGARGRARGATHKREPFRYVVAHTPEGGENIPIERWLGAAAAPAFPPSRCFQTKTSDGLWQWETADGTITTDPSRARPVPPRVRGLAYRLGGHPPLAVAPGGPMPWCYGAGYMAYTDGFGGFQWTCNPELFCPNAQGGKPNFYGLSICMPGYARQTRDEWLDPKSFKHLVGFAAFIVECNERFQIPMVKVGPGELKAGKGGYCGHVDIRDAFGGTHYDPGYQFPWDVVANLVYEMENDMMQLVKIEGPADPALYAGWTDRDGFTVLRYLTDCAEMNAYQRAGTLGTTVRTVLRSDLRWIRLSGSPPPPSVATVTANDFAT